MTRKREWPPARKMTNCIVNENTDHISSCVIRITVIAWSAEWVQSLLYSHEECRWWWRCRKIQTADVAGTAEGIVGHVWSMHMLQQFPALTSRELSMERFYWKVLRDRRNSIQDENEGHVFSCQGSYGCVITPVSYCRRIQKREIYCTVTLVLGQCACVSWWLIYSAFHPCWLCPGTGEIRL